MFEFVEGGALSIHQLRHRRPISAHWPAGRRHVSIKPAPSLHMSCGLICVGEGGGKTKYLTIYKRVNAPVIFSQLRHFVHQALNFPYQLEAILPWDNEQNCTVSLSSDHNETPPSLRNRNSYGFCSTLRSDHGNWKGRYCTVPSLRATSVSHSRPGWWYLYRLSKEYLSMQQRFPSRGHRSFMLLGLYLRTCRFSLLIWGLCWALLSTWALAHGSKVAGIM